MSMKKYLSIFFLLISIGVYAQVAPSKYWIQFTDKNNSPYSISNPSQYLSPKAIARRNNQGISIQQNDLPVNPAYVDSIASTGVKILYTSKWFNSVSIFTTDTIALAMIDSFSFVNTIESVAKLGGNGNKKSNIRKNISKRYIRLLEKYFKNMSDNDQSSLYSPKGYNYGPSLNQISMIGGVYLHDQGYLGNGITIAVLDAGFLGVDTLDAFDSLWYYNQIIGTHDFVDTSANTCVFGHHTHGTSVLSIMGGNIPDNLVGTAPKANYWLLRSEDGASEYMIEEDNWVAAAEFADSVGADIINSSLGYTVFDDSTQNHTYIDMDGNTTRVTIGADIAASKGILVVNSAGNSGASAWTYIGAPADGDSVFTIGAVDYQGLYAPFSSIGPTFDGRLKPNVVAQGQGTVIASISGGITTGNGTSFSSPVIAGMSACLWQANPGLTNMQLKYAIEESSSQFFTPDTILGYGIPDYTVANLILSGIEVHNIDNENEVNIFPNPFSDKIYVLFNSVDTQMVNIEIIDYSGRKIATRNDILRNTGYNCITIDELKDVSIGFYFLIITSDNRIITTKKLAKYK